MKKILLCSDGSQYSQVCCQYGAWLANRANASIEVLYVTDLRQFEIPLIADLSGSIGIQPYQAVLGQLQELENRKAKVILDDSRRILMDGGVPADRIRTTHKTGLLVDSLRDYESESDVILMGKRGENANFASEHLGSTMERVVRASARPCFVTSRSYRPIERLVLAYDGGPSCLKALNFLSDSPVFRGLEIHVVTVADHDADRASKHLQTAEAILRQGGFEPVCQMLQGAADEQIANYIGSCESCILAMGAYGHNRIRHLIIGSTTTEMIRSCRVPVVLFR